MSSETKTEQSGHRVNEMMGAMNTATGVIVGTPQSSFFIPGEHWDPKAGEFVQIVSLLPEEQLMAALRGGR